MAVVAFAFAVPGSLRVTGLVVLGRLLIFEFSLCAKKMGRHKEKGGSIWPARRQLPWIYLHVLVCRIDRIRSVERRHCADFRPTRT
jgi:hypothetical protein